MYTSGLLISILLINIIFGSDKMIANLNRFENKFDEVKYVTATYLIVVNYEWQSVAVVGSIILLVQKYSFDKTIDKCI